MSPVARHFLTSAARQVCRESPRTRRPTPKLFEAKERKSLSFCDLAHRIERPENWTTSLFYGKVQPESKDLCQLSEALDLSLEELVSAFQTPRPLPVLPPVIARLLQWAPSVHTSLTVHGWVKTLRNQKHLSFLELVDGSGPQHLQVILSPEQTRGLETGSAVRVVGRLVESRGGKQAKELKAEAVTILGGCVAEEYPLQKKDHSPAFLRTLPHLRPRTLTTASVLRLRSSMADRAAECLRSLDFFRTEPPVISFSDCEGAGEVFKLEADCQAVSVPPKPFFGQPAYLSVSAQLHLEAFAAGLGRTYTLGPSFRAEHSQTSRHLTEFWMLEAEMCFCESLEELMGLVEHLLRSIIAAVDEEASVVRKFIEKSDQRSSSASSDPWPQIAYSEAVELINSFNSARPPAERLPRLEWGESLVSEHEKWLAGSHFQNPVFVTDYPINLKPFYMHKNDDRATVACFDLLVPGIGELAGGSLREASEVELLKSMEERGMGGKDGKYGWYVDLRRFGSAPHGGFGIGWERLVCYIGGVENVREAIGFPRVPGSGSC